jgi:hypothetical protein
MRPVCVRLRTGRRLCTDSSRSYPERSACHAIGSPTQQTRPRRISGCRLMNRASAAANCRRAQSERMNQMSARYGIASTVAQVPAQGKGGRATVRRKPTANVRADGQKPHREAALQETISKATEPGRSCLVAFLLNALLFRHVLKKNFGDHIPPSSSGALRHSHDPDAPGTRGRPHDDDLYPLHSEPNDQKGEEPS